MLSVILKDCVRWTIDSNGLFPKSRLSLRESSATKLLSRSQRLHCQLQIVHETASIRLGTTFFTTANIDEHCTISDKDRITDDHLPSFL